MIQAALNVVAAKLGTLVARAMVGPMESLTVTPVTVQVTQDKTFELAMPAGAGAIAVPAPGAENIGRRLTFTQGTSFQHIVTFDAFTLQDGNLGPKTRWTAPVIRGGSFTVIAINATDWNVESSNRGVFS